tara:strand:+ start:3037 stop:3240 length:204 start_codon:yes stop_codon:yes gene_type:complete
VKIGDIVKLVDKPKYDWMENYLDTRFEVCDIMTESMKLKIVDSDPEWFWLVGKDSFVPAEEEENDGN